MTRASQILSLSAAILISAAVIAVISIARYRSRPENVRVVPIGDEVRYDDFAFAVVDSREERELPTPNGTLRPRGRFVVVTLRVANRAKRVAFRFRPSAIRLVAGDGHAFGVSPLVPSTGCTAELPAGATCTTDIAFDVPADSGTLRAVVGTNFGLFDLLDRVLYGKNELALE